MGILDPSWFAKFIKATKQFPKELTMAKSKIRKNKQPSSRPTGRHGYGWTPDLPDHRDHLYAVNLQLLAKLPTKMDLRPHCPGVYDQGQLGSCTANSIGAAFEFDQMKQHQKAVMPSRLFIYYNERLMEGTVASDSGAQIRDGIKSIGNQGVCPESDWPYDITKFAQKPSAQAYQDAAKSKAITYSRVARTLLQMKGCIAEGYPWVFGFTVYESFESPQVAQTGIVPMPGSSEQVLGGHAVLCVGYDDSQQRFIVRNSWGTGWGIQGYFLMPYAYLLEENLSDDFWTVRVVS
jgi:C1A family cysteine protease